MAREAPVLLRLPFWLADRGFALERVLASDPELPWSRAWELLPLFELSGPERGFARELLVRKRNLWLFRCNQKAATGDFVVVDMSSPEISRRAVFVIELKTGSPVQLGGKGASGQLEHAALALDELRRQGIAEAIAELVAGDERAVLQWFLR